MKRTIKFSGKTSDCFNAELREDGKQVGKDYEGYPPSFLGYDGIDLEIDLDTGQVLNWKKPEDKVLTNLFELEDDKL